MRVKSGNITSKRRKKVIKQAKGYYGAKHKLYKTSKEQVMKSHQYAFQGRKKRKPFFRQLWIVRINGALKERGISYSKFIYALKLKNIELNRKMISEMIIENPLDFDKLVNIAKESLVNDVKSKGDK